MTSTTSTCVHWAALDLPCHLRRKRRLRKSMLRLEGNLRTTECQMYVNRICLYFYCVCAFVCMCVLTSSTIFLNMHFAGDGVCERKSQSTWTDQDSQGLGEESGDSRGRWPLCGCVIWELPVPAPTGTCDYTPLTSNNFCKWIRGRGPLGANWA